MNFTKYICILFVFFFFESSYLHSEMLLNKDHFLEDARHDKFDINQIKLWIKKDKSRVFLGDQDGNTILHYAALFDNEDVVKLALRYHAHPHQPNNKGETAFNLAAPTSMKALRILSLYWFKMAKRNEKPGLNDLSGLYKSPLIQYAAKSCTPKEAKRIMNAKVGSEYTNLFVKDASGWTPLHAVAAMASPGRDEIAELIIRKYLKENKDFLMARTTEDYIAEYKRKLTTTKVKYSQASTAYDICKARLEQDQALSNEEIQVLNNTCDAIYSAVNKK